MKCYYIMAPTTLGDALDKINAVNYLYYAHNVNIIHHIHCCVKLLILPPSLQSIGGGVTAII